MEEEIIKDLEKYISFANKNENFSHDTDWKWHQELASYIESLLKAYKQDEEVIDEMAETLTCLPLNENIDIFYRKEEVKEYFRKKVETNE